MEKEYDLKVIAPKSNNYATVPSHTEMLDQFEVVLTQGGLTSISEVIAKNKFLVVIPIKDHSEQILNAATVEDLGLGVTAKLSDLDDFPKFLSKIKEKKAACMKTNGKVNCNGAAESAQFIKTLLLSADA